MCAVAVYSLACSRADLAHKGLPRQACQTTQTLLFLLKFKKSPRRIFAVDPSPCQRVVETSARAFVYIWPSLTYDAYW